MPGGRRAVARNIRRGLSRMAKRQSVPPRREWSDRAPAHGSFLPFLCQKTGKMSSPAAGPPLPARSAPRNTDKFSPGHRRRSRTFPIRNDKKIPFSSSLKVKKKTRDPLCIPKHGNFPDGRRRRPTYVGAPLYHSPPAENKTANNRLTCGNFTIKKRCFDSETCDASHVPVQRPSIDTIGLLEDCGKKW